MCPSGLRSTPGTRVGSQGSRRFESSRFRQEVMKIRTSRAVFLLLFFRKVEDSSLGSLSNVARLLFLSLPRYDCKMACVARHNPLFLLASFSSSAAGISVILAYKVAVWKILQLPRPPVVV